MEDPGRSSVWFVVGIVGIVGASLFAGSQLAPMIARTQARRALDRASAGEIAATLEHAAVDVKLGRGAEALETLGRVAARVQDPAVKPRALELWAEAALQAGKLAVAETAEEQAEAAVTDAKAKRAIQMRRIGLLATLNHRAAAEDLADNLIRSADDPAVADEARWRVLAATKTRDQLTDWIKVVKPDELEPKRRLAIAALRILNDATTAERLLSELEKQGQKDAGLYRALLFVYGQLKRPADTARVALQLAPLLRDERELSDLALARADALASAGDFDGALAAIDVLLAHSRVREARGAARRLRYQVLDRAGRLKAEIAAVEKRGDRATRAFIALEIEGNYTLAASLYDALAKSNPDSSELAEATREAQRRKDLAERRTLYTQVLAKDPTDRSAREKLLITQISLGDAAGARKTISEWISGHEKDAQLLLEVATVVAKAGLAQDAASILEEAHSIERDPGKKQQILFVLGDLYAASRQEDNARQLYTDLAMQGVSPEVRDQAVARLATLLHF